MLLLFPNYCFGQNSQRKSDQDSRKNLAGRHGKLKLGAFCGCYSHFEKACRYKFVNNFACHLSRGSIFSLHALHDLAHETDIFSFERVAEDEFSKEPTTVKQFAEQSSDLITFDIFGENTYRYYKAYEIPRDTSLLKLIDYKHLTHYIEPCIVSSEISCVAQTGNTLFLQIPFQNNCFNFVAEQKRSWSLRPTFSKGVCVSNIGKSLNYFPWCFDDTCGLAIMEGTWKQRKLCLLLSKEVFCPVANQFWFSYTRYKPLESILHQTEALH